jgi:NADH dehydrogenase
MSAVAEQALRPHRPRVVIVGAGFAGLTLARKLRWAPVDVTLVDRNNYHLFTPLVYQVASSLLEPAEIAQPVRKLVRPLRNCDFRLGTVTAIDVEQRRVHTDQGDLDYDFLVVAAGSENNYFGNQSLQDRSLALKDLPEALRLRNWVLDRFERSRWEGSAEKRRAMLTFAVVGGGPTGVEYAGALSELIRLVLRKDFRLHDLSEARVILLEGADRLLLTFEPSLSAAALRSLERKHVEVHLRSLVQEVGEGSLQLTDGRTLEAGSVVWTAGVRGSSAGALLGVPTDRQGRVPVSPTLQLHDHPEVFVIGDLAALQDLPMLAQVAMQEARHVARTIHATLTNRPTRPFQYRDPGIMATIGRNSAVAQIGPLRFSGLIGWWIWLVVHLVNIVTFRARVVTLLNWAWDYVFYDRPVRLMVRAASPPGEG